MKRREIIQELERAGCVCWCATGRAMTSIAIRQLASSDQCRATMSGKIVCERLTSHGSALLADSQQRSEPYN